MKSARREIEELVASLALPVHTAGVSHMEQRRLWRERVVGFYRELARDPAGAAS